MLAAWFAPMPATVARTIASKGRKGLRYWSPTLSIQQLTSAAGLPPMSAMPRQKRMSSVKVLREAMSFFMFCAASSLPHVSLRIGVNCCVPQMPISVESPCRR